MLKTTSNTTTKEQLAQAALASLKMLLVSLALIVVVIVLFVKSLLSFAVVMLTALNLLGSWMIDLVVASHEMREFCQFLATR